VFNPKVAYWKGLKFMYQHQCSYLLYDGYSRRKTDCILEVSACRFCQTFDICILLIDHLHKL